jgi:putative sporulation protein YyaC
MEIMSFDYKSENLSLCIAKTLEKYLISPIESMILLFVGSDSNIGDSLAPICGSLFECDSGGVFAYGSLVAPITAKEVPFAVEFIKKAHPDSLVVVIDAAIGKSCDVGLIKVQKGGIKPGLGVDKDLPLVGDLSVIGILGEKKGGKALFTVNKISTVYKMAEKIADGLKIFVKNNQKRLKFCK